MSIVARLTIKLFGPFEMYLDGKPLQKALTKRKGERLVALLTLHYNHEVANKALASALWPITESLESLRASVGYLRNVLDQESVRVETVKEYIHLNLKDADVDLIAFDRAITQGDIESLQAAVTLYRGPLLNGWEEDWVVRERDRRKSQYQAALKALSDELLLRAEPARAIPHLRMYLKFKPGEEGAWCDLMKALVTIGERVMAMEVYHTCREVFQNRFKLSPPDEMTHLYQTIQLPQARPKIDIVASIATVPEEQMELEPVGGAMPLRSDYYMERPTDAFFQKAISRRDSIVLVKGPRQTGKTSLLARGLQQAREAGASVILTDFQKMSADHHESLNAFFLALAQSIADQLDLQTMPRDIWSDARGANENFERYLRREVLGKVPTPIVWGLDEVDRLFTYPFSTSIFALFRSWHNERALDPSSPWERLTLAIAYATEAYLFIADLNQSPFNVGTRLMLEDFDVEQVAELNRRYGSPLRDPNQEKDYFRLIGGNPYLVRRGLYEIVTHSLDFKTFADQASLDEGCYGDHLHRMLLALSQNADLLTIVRGILQGQPCPTPESFYRLRAAGLLTGGSPQNALFRCDLYRAYLEAHLR